MPKQIVKCYRCPATSTPRKFFSEGWIRVELSYTNGGKSRTYTCAKCRAELIAKKITVPTVTPSA